MEASSERADTMLGAYALLQEEATEGAYADRGSFGIGSSPSPRITRPPSRVPPGSCRRDSQTGGRSGGSPGPFGRGAGRRLTRMTRRVREQTRILPGDDSDANERDNDARFFGGFRRVRVRLRRALFRWTMRPVNPPTY
eukprot:834568-Prorocentrum_minimum.AAC.1